MAGQNYTMRISRDVALIKCHWDDELKGGGIGEKFGLCGTENKCIWS